jgi:hypothetical protein
VAVNLNCALDKFEESKKKVLLFQTSARLRRLKYDLTFSLYVNSSAIHAENAFQIEDRSVLFHLV